MDLLRRFRYVKMSVSIDAIGPQNDYIRFGSDFHQIVDNLHRVRADCPHVELEPSTCVSILNVQSLPEIRDYFAPLCRSHSFSNLLPARPLSRQGICPRLRQALEKLRGSRQDFSSVTRWVDRELPPGEQDSLFRLFAAYVNQLDADRGTDFAAVFPDLGEYVTALGPQPDLDPVVSRLRCGGDLPPVAIDSPSEGP